MAFLFNNTLSLNAYAMEKNPNMIYTLSHEEPIESELKERDTSRPNISETWDIATDGNYNYSGTTTGGRTLYTNYQFYGRTSYVVQVKNNSSETVTVKILSTIGITEKTHTVDAGHTAYISYSTGNKTKQFYVSFDAPTLVNVSGKIY